jgi:hypothetical protein
MADIPTWLIEADLPDLDGTWKDSEGRVIDLTEYTFVELRIGDEGKPALLTKTSGVTFAATDPNVTVAWDAGELAALVPLVTYSGLLVATRIADDKKREMPFKLYLQDAVRAAAP